MPNLKILSLTWYHDVLQWLKTIDQWLFIYINNVWTNSVFDSIVPIWRESITWYPLYIFLLFLVVINFGWKSVSWILFFVFTVIICDQISSGIIKDWIGRSRPCGDPEFSQYVRLLLNRCPGSGSFTSSHATNHFGMAAFSMLTLSGVIGKWKYLFLAWAVTISYGQVYVGVHYPLDVIGGGVLGAIIAWAMSFFYKKNFGEIGM
jgi:membrane-associated phospholipid phosphatase